MLLEMHQLEKNVGDRLLFRLDHMTVYPGDRIGLVGSNGAGKSTLLDIMAGHQEADKGLIRRLGKVSYIPQLSDAEQIDYGYQGKGQQWMGQGINQKSASGGERTRQKIAVALAEDPDLLLADEPSVSLDLEGIEKLQKELEEFSGAFVLVSHDRELLDRLCHSIWELEDGAVWIYNGNYSSYVQEKERRRQRQWADYLEYQQQKEDLQKAIADRQHRAVTMRKTPARMGNSEARLHKMGNQKAKKNVYKAVSAMEKRLGKLDAKERPKDKIQAYFGGLPMELLRSKFVVEGQGIEKKFGSRLLFQNVNFSVRNGQRIALIGANGCGKSTLLSLIAADAPGIVRSRNVKYGYFVQQGQNLDEPQTLLSYVMETAACRENDVRLLLGNLLFSGKDVYKTLDLLSGGECAKAAMAKILASQANVLLLDEPTNYMDSASAEALLQILKKYPGTILFASHDRYLINQLATHLMPIENQTCRTIEGNYADYMEQKKKGRSQEEELLRSYRLAEVISRLSTVRLADEKEKLEKEYQELINRTK